MDRNCSGAKKDFKHVTANGASFDRCPKAWLASHRHIVDMIDDWHFMRSFKSAPVAGGRLDQHPLFLQAGEIIEQEIERAKKNEVEKYNVRK